MIKLESKSEWFILDKPFAEPNERWNDEDKYHIERLVRRDGATVWYGLSTNWKKELNGEWKELSTNYDAKPLEKWLPDTIYGEDRQYWKECGIPMYEQMYLSLNKDSTLYTLGDVVDAVQYGFDYRVKAQNDGIKVPNGNTLQWLMSKKGLLEAPDEFNAFKNKL